MDNKRGFIRLLELYLNRTKKQVVEDFYGKGTYLKIHNIDFSPVKNHAMVEVVIILGDIISEKAMDEKMASVLVSDGFDFFFRGTSIHLVVRWDV